jgi:hypothetical protein
MHNTVFKMCFSNSLSLVGRLKKKYIFPCVQSKTWTQRDLFRKVHLNLARKVHEIVFGIVHGFGRGFGRRFVRKIVSRVDASFYYRTEIWISIRFAANPTPIRTGNRIRVDGPLVRSRN